MAANAFMLIGDTDGVYRDLVERVVASWPADKRPPITTISFEDALKNEDWIKKARITWLLSDHHTNDQSLQADSQNKLAKHQLHQVIGMLDEHHKPSVVTRNETEDVIGSAYANGAVLAPSTASPLAICAVLRTLWNQHDTVRSLMLEIEILNAHNGGMATQFDKLDEELRMASQLQREFMPKDLPTMDGVDFRVLFRPASYVSGDIYDVVKLDDKHMGFFVADAVGHGVPAALLTVYIKRSLRTGHRKDDKGNKVSLIQPDESLQYLNRDMIKQQSGNIRFATALYGILDTETLQLTFSRAGHPYPMLLRKNGEIDWLKAEGGLLGIFPEEEFETSTVQLTKGDRIVLYSDGFELAFPPDKNDPNKSKRVANDNYMQEFEKLAAGSIDEAFDRFANKLDQQSGSLNQLDDLTALLIEVG
jgi:phosphoserine phosphatase RsbU/P